VKLAGSVAAAPLALAASAPPPPCGPGRSAWTAAAESCGVRRALISSAVKGVKLDEEGRDTLREALRQRDPGIAPIETLRLLAHRLIAEQSPFVEFSAQRFIETIEGSETLKARARAIRDELTHVVTVALSESVGREPTDPDAYLAAGLLLATWTVGFIQAHRTFRQKRDAEQAKAAFLAIVDKGSIGLEAAMAGTPYA
jgi:hypothetical protein